MKDFQGLSRVEQHTFPGARTNYTEPPTIENSDTLWMTTRDGDWLAGVYVPGSARSDLCIIHFYGHNETLRSAEFIAQARQHLDAALLCFDYRGYGASTGRPNEGDFYADAEFIFDWLADNHPGLKAVACGRSLGAAVATHLAGVRPVRGLALISAPTNMVDVVRPIFPPDEIVIEEAIPFRFDTLSGIAKVECPIFMCHGESDTIVPHRMCDALAACNARSISRLDVPQAGYGDLLNIAGERLWIAFRAFLEQL